MRHPKDHISFNPLTNGHIIEEKVGGEIWKAQIEFVDSSQLFDITKFQEANVEAAFCAKGTSLREKLHGVIIHLMAKHIMGLRCEAGSGYLMHQKKLERV